MGRKFDGTLVPYPSDQEFEVWMNTDESYGRLRSSWGDEGWWVYGTQPFEFIAADSIDVDSAVVEIEVSIGGGIATSIRDGDNVRLPAGLTLRRQTVSGEKATASATQRAVKERIARRSIEKLLRRLYAIREKGKDKLQIDKIIAEMEARLMSAGEGSRETITPPEPLAKAGQTAMSVEGEGATCEPPIAQVVVKGSPFHHFLVTVQPDTIEHGDTATVRVQARDEDNQDVELAGETLLNALSDGAGQTYGKLVGPRTTGPLVETGYAEIQLGKLRYVADGENPVGLPAQLVKISVVLSDDETKEGIGTLAVKPSIEKFCQGDSKWAGTKYDKYVRKKKDGTGDSTDAQGNKVYYGVGDKGCALTCMAMVAKAGGADTDPGKLAEYMNEHDGFQGVRVKWAATNTGLANRRFKVEQNSYEGSGLQYEDDGVTVDLENSKAIGLSKMDTELSNGALIIAQVYNPTTGNQHWVLVTQKQGDTYKILDPGCYEGRNDLTAYSSNVYKIVIYRRK